MERMLLLENSGWSEGQRTAGPSDNIWTPTPPGSPPATPTASPKAAQNALPIGDETNAKESRKAKARAAKRDRRRRKRHEEKQDVDLAAQAHRESQSEKYPSGKRIRTNRFTIQQLPATSNVWTGKNLPAGDATKTLEELVHEGYRIVEWDGERPLLLEDAQGRIFVALAGRPVNDPTWKADVQDRTDALFAEAEAEVRTTTCKNCEGPLWAERCSKCRNRRGDFKVINIGTSFGGGQMEPGMLVNDRPAARAASNIIQSPCMKRLVGFINSAFSWFAPKLYRVYAANNEKILSHHPHLQPLFANSVFPTATLNLGPQVVTLEHTDSGNLPFGWCAIFATGRFDPKRGGHLILRDLKLLIGFPPGSVIFLPLGTLMHGNTAVQPHETRRSFTQYAPGGLFRWVYYGYRTEGQMSAIDPERTAHSYASSSARRVDALGLFSTSWSLHKDRCTPAP
ncbi:hypothetical protein EIP86_008431 [Pleurotus ostreatoroseus]|nr:hypothetical protein EIP86_008431 [Pleurotus ostreatoroseus]